MFSSASGWWMKTARPWAWWPSTVPTIAWCPPERGAYLSLPAQLLVDEEGSVLIYYKSSGVTKSMIDFLGEETWQQVQLGNVQKVEYNLDGRPVFGYFKSIYGTSMYAVTALDKSDIVQPLQSWLVTRLLIVLGICLLVGVVISEVMSFRYARPVMVLGNRIRAIADGKPEEPAPFPSPTGDRAHRGKYSVYRHRHCPAGEALADGGAPQLP